MSKARGDHKRSQHSARARGSSPADRDSKFLFMESPADFHDDSALVVHVSDADSEQQLFDVLAEKLRFPDYFGRNWDALEECLRDLSWLPKDQPIVIVHDDLPLSANDASRSIYLDLLISVMKHWQAIGERSFHMIMPASLRDPVSQAAKKRR
jgi:RNAse (barnase) inhibitor barstar